MTFPNRADFNLVAASTSSGEVDFLGVGSPVTHEIPGAVNGAWYWSVSGGHGTDNFSARGQGR
jgi:hypothetical protein